MEWGAKTFTSFLALAALALAVKSLGGVIDFLSAAFFNAAWSAPVDARPVNGQIVGALELT